MGVHGLWELLLPVGCRVDSGNVSRKTVAVDISIWLSQFLSAMREADGAVVRNAHLLGVLRRCCKLLYLGVRPVFIFDGATPALKRRTIAMRRSLHDRQAAKLRRTAEQLVLNRLKAKLLAKHGQPRSVHRGTTGRKSQSNSKPPLPSSDTCLQSEESNDSLARWDTGQIPSGSAMDRYVASAVHLAQPATGAANERARLLSATAPIASGNHQSHSMSDDENDGESDSFQGIIALPEDIHDINDEQLVNMPPELQSEMFKQIKLQQRRVHRETVLEMQSSPTDFSKAQISGFLRNTALNRRIANVKAVINNQSGASRRIASDNSREYIFEEIHDDDDDEDDIDDRYAHPDIGDESHALQGVLGKASEQVVDDDIDFLKNIRLQNACNGKGFTLKHQSSLATTRSDVNETENAGVAWAGRVLSNGGCHQPGGVESRTERGVRVSDVGNSRMLLFGSGKCYRQQYPSIYLADGEVDDWDLYDPECTSGEGCNLSALNSRSSAAAAPENNEPSKAIERTNSKQIDSSDEELEWEDGDQKALAFHENGKLQGIFSEDAPNAANCSAIEIERTGIDIEQETIQFSKDLARGVGDVVRPTYVRLEDTAKREGDDGHCRKSLKDVQKSALKALENAFPALRRGDEAIVASATFQDDQLSVALGEGTQKVAKSPVHGEQASCAPSHRDICPELSLANGLEESERLIGSPNGDSTDSNGDSQSLEPREYVLNHGIADVTNFVTASKNKMTTSHETSNSVTASLKSSSVNCQGFFPKQGDSALVVEGTRCAHPTDSSADISMSNRPVKGLDESCGRRSDELHFQCVVQSSSAPEQHSGQARSPILNPRQVQNNRLSDGSSESLSDEMFGETRDLLRLLGLPYLEAPMEAEAQCAYLNQTGVVDAVITEDSDAFLFGAKVVYRNLFFDGKFAEMYDVACIESELGVDRERLIKLALLLGSDYTEGVRGVGIVNSMEILQAFQGESGLDEFKNWVKSVTLLQDNEPENDEREIVSPASVRQRFCWKHRNMKRNWEIPSSFPSSAVADAYWHPEVDKSVTPFTWKPIDVEGLQKFCWDKFGWDERKFVEATGPVLKQMRYISERKSEGQQSVIEDFFKPHRFAKIRSERLKLAIKGVAGDNATSLVPEPGELRRRAKRRRISK